jgi:hypothetical protein
VVDDEEAHVPRVQENHSPKERQYTAHVGLLGKTTGPEELSILRCPPADWLMSVGMISGNS